MGTTSDFGRSRSKEDGADLGVVVIIIDDDDDEERDVDEGNVVVRAMPMASEGA
jgi:hypothetical protein